MTRPKRKISTSSEAVSSLSSSASFLQSTDPDGHDDSLTSSTLVRSSSRNRKKPLIYTASDDTVKSQSTDAFEGLSSDEASMDDSDVDSPTPIRKKTAASKRARTVNKDSSGSLEDRRVSDRIANLSSSEVSSPAPTITNRPPKKTASVSKTPESTDAPMKLPQVGKRAANKISGAVDLFYALSQPKANTKQILATWHKALSNNEAQAFLDVIKLLIQSAGYLNDTFDGLFSGEISFNTLGGDNSAKILDALQSSDSVNFSARSEYPFLVKQKAKNSFKSKFDEFFNGIIEDLHPSLLPRSSSDSDEDDGFEQNVLFNNILYWIISMTSCQYRPFRHVATAAGLTILTSMTRTVNSVSEDTGKVYLFEKYMRLLFDGIFISRYRDVDHAIRSMCIESLGDCIRNYPSFFLNNSFLRYLGWMLHDKHHEPRLLTIAAIRALLVDSRTGESTSIHVHGMRQFIERFSKRIVELSLWDKHGECQVMSYRLLSELVKHHLIDQDGVMNSFLHLFDYSRFEHPQLHELCSTVFCEWYAASFIDDDSLLESPALLLRQHITWSRNIFEDTEAEPVEVDYSRFYYGLLTAMIKYKGVHVLKFKAIFLDPKLVIDCLLADDDQFEFDDFTRLLIFCESLSLLLDDPTLQYQMAESLTAKWTLLISKFVNHSPSVVRLLSLFSKVVLPHTLETSPLTKESNIKDFLVSVTSILSESIAHLVLKKFDSEDTISAAIKIIHDIYKTPGLVGQKFIQDFCKNLQLHVVHLDLHWCIWLSHFNPYKIDTSFEVDFFSLSNPRSLLKLIAYSLASSNVPSNFHGIIESVVVKGADDYAKLELVLLSRKNRLFTSSLSNPTNLFYVLQKVYHSLYSSMVNCWKMETYACELSTLGVLKARPLLPKSDITLLTVFLATTLSLEKNDKHEDMLLSLYSLMTAGQFSSILSASIKQYLSKLNRPATFSFLGKFMLTSYKFYLTDYASKNPGQEELDFEDSFWSSYGTLFARIVKLSGIDSQKEKEYFLSVILLMLVKDMSLYDGLFYWISNERILSTKPSSNMVGKAFLTALNEMRSIYNTQSEKDEVQLECYWSWRKIIDRHYPCSLDLNLNLNGSTPKAPAQEPDLIARPISTVPLHDPDLHVESAKNIQQNTRFFDENMKDLSEEEVQDENSHLLQHTADLPIRKVMKASTLKARPPPLAVTATSQSEYIFPSSPI